MHTDSPKGLLPGNPASDFPQAVLFPVFVISGVSALIYQIVWQRALFMIYGSNSESVAMVVAAFLTGLGIGSVVGGVVSKKANAPLILLFSGAEIVIGLYGLVSLRVFAWAGDVTSGAGAAETGVLAFALVFVPTLMMGATLPLLVAQQVRAKGHVGEAVSWLYFVNTLGAGCGAFLATFYLFRWLGLSGTATFAAALNFMVSLVVLTVWLLNKRSAMAP